MAMPVDAAKEFYDYRTGDDFESQGTNCGELLIKSTHDTLVVAGTTTTMEIRLIVVLRSTPQRQDAKYFTT